MLPPSCGGESQAFVPAAAAEGTRFSIQQRWGAQADAILIPSDAEFDLDGRSDTSFESIDKLLPDAHTKVKSACVTGAGMCLDLAFLGRPTC
jgi:hypothetical protein